MTILVTGASGFVGQALVRQLSALNQQVRATSRHPSQQTANAVEWAVSPELNADSIWRDVLQNINCVIHCAARVHVMNELTADPLSEFRRINVEGTRALAIQAADAGVTRFVFLISIKVNGERTTDQQIFAADDRPNPSDPYALSKLEAEQALFEIGLKTGMEIVVIRPALVYGPGVKANFEQMMRVLQKGLPLPFGAVNRNKRSMVGLANLIDLIILCTSHPAAANQVFLASDGEDISTRDLLIRLSSALGKPARLISIPPWLLLSLARILGKMDFYQRLCGSLQIDIRKNQELLNWTPPESITHGLELTAQHFNTEAHSK